MDYMLCNINVILYPCVHTFIGFTDHGLRHMKWLRMFFHFTI